MSSDDDEVFKTPQNGPPAIRCPGPHCGRVVAVFDDGKGSVRMQEHRARGLATPCEKSNSVVRPSETTAN